MTWTAARGHECQCGCGGAVGFYTRTCKTKGYTKGQPHMFRQGHNHRSGHRKVDDYLKKKFGETAKLVHVLVAEQALGRSLPPGAEVHHVDGNTYNNSPSNLVICQSRAYHLLLHVRQRVLAAGGDPNTQRLCKRCKQPTFDKNLSGGRFTINNICRLCKRLESASYRASKLLRSELRLS